jgi:cupin 2 domain-containing protein
VVAGEPPSVNNLFDKIPDTSFAELSDTLVETTSVRIERIVSFNHVSPKDFWYDQEQNEWVVVIQGRAKILFAGENVPLEMGPGDFVNIPAHQRHRIEWTTPDEPTIWLAVFYSKRK